MVSSAASASVTSKTAFKKASGAAFQQENSRDLGLAYCKEIPHCCDHCTARRSQMLSFEQRTVMSRRINVILPDATVAVLDRVARKGNRSRLISQAVLHYVRAQGAENLKERLKQGALANAKLNLEIAEEWFPAEQEAWQKLEQEERATKATRSAVRSTSRRSTRR